MKQIEFELVTGTIILAENKNGFDLEVLAEEMVCAKCIVVIDIYGQQHIITLNNVTRVSEVGDSRELPRILAQT